jgi:hypothetical protein
VGRTCGTHGQSGNGYRNLVGKPEGNIKKLKLYLWSVSWRYMEEWEYSSTILELDARWSWVVSFTPRPLYPRERRPRYPLDRTLNGLQSRSGRCGEENNFAMPGMEPGPSSSLAIAIPNELSRLLKLIVKCKKLLKSLLTNVILYWARQYNFNITGSLNFVHCSVFRKTLNLKHWTTSDWD